MWFSILTEDNSMITYDKFLRRCISIDALSRSLQELNLDGDWEIAYCSNYDNQDFDLKLSITVENTFTMLRINKVINVLNHKPQQLNKLLEV